MSRSSAKSRLERSGDYKPPLTTTVLSLVIGYIGGEKLPIAARLFLHVWNAGDSYPAWRDTEASLVMLFVLSFTGIVLGAFLAKRGWVTDTQIIVAIVTATLSAVFIMLEDSVLNRSSLPLNRMIYFLGWPTLMYFLSPVLIPRTSMDERVTSAARLISVSTLVAVSCWATGAILVELFRIWPIVLIHDIVMAGGTANLADSRKFWTINPSGFNAVCGAYVVVAFVPLWWRRIWWRISATVKGIWIICYSLASIAYGGLYGKQFYVSNAWARALVGDSSTISDWRFFFVFAAYAVVPLVSMFLCFLFTRQKIRCGQEQDGWPVSRRFWWFLPVSIGVGFAIVVLIFVVPLLRNTGVTSLAQVVFLMSAHVINGIVLGFTLRLFDTGIRLIMTNRSG